MLGDFSLKIGIPLVACCISLLHHRSWSRQMGAGLVRFRISVVQWGTTAPANLISAHCWLVHVEGFFSLLLSVSLTPLTDYLIAPHGVSLTRRCFIFASSRIPCSIYCLLLFQLALWLFSFLFCPICSTSCTRYGEHLGREGLVKDGWVDGWDCCFWDFLGRSLFGLLMALIAAQSSFNTKIDNIFRLICRGLSTVS